jgi:DNA-binding SARP family transcriptional activator/nucleoid-associated protein YgaU
VPRHSRTLRVLAGLAALVAVAAVIAGVPLVLLAAWRYLGPPWPTLHELLAPDDGTLFVRVLCAVGWVCWATFTWSVLAELFAQWRGWQLPTLGWRRTAAGLVTAITIMLSTPAGGALTGTPARAAPVVLTTPPPDTPSTPDTVVSTVDSALPAPAPSFVEHRVLPGEQLPALAQRYLGDKYQWRAIAEASYGLRQPDGQALRPGDTRVYPGWTVRIPQKPAQRPVAGSTYQVRHGDWLWGIADRYLDDPLRYPEIAELNPHLITARSGPHGPDHIEAGWRLRLPADAHDRGVRDHATGHLIPPPPPAGVPGQPDQKGTSANPPRPPDAQVPAPRPDTSDPATPPGPSATPLAPSATPAPDSSPANGPAASETPQPQASRPHGVTLTSGSWLDLGLAVAVATAVALVWTHRRRRYTRRPPSPDLRLDGPDVAPMPPLVNQIRRRLRHDDEPAGEADAGAPLDRFTDIDDTLDFGDAAPVPGDRPDTDPVADGPPPVVAQWQNGPSLAGPGRPDPDDQPTAASDAVDPRPDGTGAAVPGPAVPSLSHPLTAVWPPAGLGLTGDGAEAAARGFLTAALAAGGLDAPEDRSWVIMPSAVAATLLGTSAVSLPHTPRLTITAGLDEALDLLEAQTLHRSRLVYTHEVDTVAELRAADPAEEPLPPILLLADATGRHQRTRIAALLAQGQRLDIHGILLGDWPDGDTVAVAADGTTRRADRAGSRHGGHPADLGRLAVLTPAETSDLLATLAESHTGTPQAPAPVEPAPASLPTPPASTDPQPRPTDPASHPTPPVVPPPPATQPPQSTPAAGGPAPGWVNGHSPAAGDPAQPQPQPPPTPATTAASLPDGTDRIGSGTDATVRGAGRVQVRVLGQAGILDIPPGPTPRKKSLEVLVYLAVHDGAASAEAILDDLLPDAPAAKAPGRLYTYISDLRTVMRRTGGPGSYLTHPDHRYVLNPDTVEVDLWRMRDALREAQKAADTGQRIAALRRAVDCYTGHLADGADYEWVEPYREAIRQQALDAYLALADALADQPGEQLTVLDAAIRHNPYVEEPYQQAMRVRAALGHTDAVRSLRRALTRALGEIDAEPSDQTIALADQLVAQARRPSPRPHPGPHPAPRTGDGAST